MYFPRQKNRLARERILNVEAPNHTWAREKFGSYTKLNRQHHIISYSVDACWRSVRVWYKTETDLLYPEGDCPLGAVWLAGIELGKETPEAFPFLTAGKYREVAEEDLATKYRAVAGQSEAVGGRRGCYNYETRQ